MDADETVVQPSVNSNGAGIVSRLSVPKSADVLAAQLRQTVLSGQLSEGQALAAERELAEQSGLSRVTVRAALRTLQAEGLIEIRSGRNGGAFVLKPASGVMARSVDIFVRGGRVELKTILEVRSVMEPGIAALAATYRTEDDLAALDRLQENAARLVALISARSRRSPSILTEIQANNLRWHLAMVAASKNDLFIGFLTGLSQPIIDATRVRSVETIQATIDGQHAHDRILDAVRAGDADAARRRMERHMAHYCSQAMAK